MLIFARGDAAFARSWAASVSNTMAKGRKVRERHQLDVILDELMKRSQEV
jgi:hypothetical protein